MPQNYPTDMRAAAFRHKQAADELMDGHRIDVAGYLYGITAECGLKALMLALGMRPLPPEQRMDDPFYAHFMALKILILDSDQGRKHHELRKFAGNDGFMNFWDISMRYSSGKDIDRRWIERWKADAADVLAEL